MVLVDSSRIILVKFLYGCESTVGLLLFGVLDFLSLKKNELLEDCGNLVSLSSEEQPSLKLEISLVELKVLCVDAVIAIFNFLETSVLIGSLMTLDDAIVEGADSDIASFNILARFPTESLLLSFEGVIAAAAVIGPSKLSRLQDLFSGVGSINNDLADRKYKSESM